MPIGIHGSPSKLSKGFPFSPIKKAPKHRIILVYDFESKEDLSSHQPGFTRPFMVGFLDHDGIYHSFFDEHRLTPHPSLSDYLEDLFGDEPVKKWNLLRTAIVSGADVSTLDREKFARAEKIEEEYKRWLREEAPDFRQHTLNLGGCIDRFMRHVLQMNKKKTKFVVEWTSDVADIYAHNGGRFDATFLLVWLYQHRDEFSISISCIQGRVQALTVWPKKGKRTKQNSITFLDSALLLVMKLDQATQLFSKGAKKQKFDQKTIDIDYANWIEYNRYDCLGLRDAIHGFRDMLEEEGGELAMTAPAASMKLFRRRFLKDSFPRAQHFPGCDGACYGCTRGSACDGGCHGCLHEWIRRGYFGGRVEILERFAPAPVFGFDRNSSYPAAMLSPMPVGNPIAVHGEEEFFRCHEAMRAEGKLAFVECRVYLPPTCKLPPLPVLSEGKLKFPTGSFSGVFEYDELMLIFDSMVCGKILSVTRAVWFNSKVIFKDFVETLYKYKQEASKIKEKKKKVSSYEFTDEERGRIALGELAKLMMNSLYGKFAMNPEREEIIYVGDDESWPDDAKPITGMHEDCNIWIRPNYVDPSYVIPQWSARITALGRTAWWTAARDVLLAGGKVYYGDTDSIKSSIPFPEHLVHESNLGMWKEEREEDLFDADYLFILPKFYGPADGRKIKGAYHMKGVPRDFHDGQTFVHMSKGGKFEARHQRMSQPKTVMRSVQLGGTAGIVMQDSIKRLRSLYSDKRIVHDDGSTSPIVLNE